MGAEFFNEDEAQAELLLSPKLLASWAQYQNSTEKAPELSFQKELQFRHEFLSRDRGPWTGVGCSAEGQIFARLSLPDRSEALLWCENEDMEGVRLILPPLVSGAPPRAIQLGLLFGDAGEASDTRTWIRREGEGLRLLRATRWSFHEMAGDPLADNSEAPPQCGMEVETLFFKSAKEELSEFTEAEIKEGEIRFEPPPQIDEDCEI